MHPTCKATRMETRSIKKKKTALLNASDDQSTTDRITNLPDPILHHILSLLPIKFIARTSILSKRFRSLWSSFPDLDFTSTTINPSASSSSSSPSSSSSSKAPFRAKRSSSYVPCKDPSTTDLITRVLTLREKHSDLRTLRFRSRLGFSRLNGLFRYAIRHNVQELDVEVSTNDYFNFPRGAISSETLRVLMLKSTYPGFRLLPSSVMSRGFKHLHTLSLSLVISYDEPSLLDLFTEASFPRLKKLILDACFGMKHLKIGCNALEELTLENCFQLRGLEICCSKLEAVRVVSCFDAYCDDSWVSVVAPRLKVFAWEYNAITGSSLVDNLTLLHEASVGFFVLHEDVSAGKVKSVCNLLSGLSHANTLTLESQCVEIISNKIHHINLVRPFFNLEVLEINTGFNDNNVPGLAFLFKSSPKLHMLTLKIINDCKTKRRKFNRDLSDVHTSWEEQYWESQAQNLKPFLENLQLVTIDGFFDCKNEVSFAIFLLKHGKALQEMSIRTVRCNYRDSLRRQNVRSQMTGFSRASSKAKITFR